MAGAESYEPHIFLETPTNNLSMVETNPHVTAFGDLSVTAVQEKITTTWSSLSTFSCFFKLPTEVRRLVYSELLICKHGFSVSMQPGWIIGVSITSKPKPGAHTTILRTCRQAYDEGIGMLYANNEFISKHGADEAHFQLAGANRYMGKFVPSADVSNTSEPTFSTQLL